MYAKASKPQGGDGAGAGESPGADKGKDDVVEAEFEEVKE
jgi:hypothetical protein